MVRFSDIVKTDGMTIREPPVPERELPAEEPEEIDAKITGPNDAKLYLDMPLADTGRDEIRTCYRQLFKNTVALRDRVLKGREIDPSPVISIFRHIIEDDLIEDIYQYAASVPDDFGPPSYAISVTLALLRMGKKLGYGISTLLKSGFAALLRNVDREDLPDRILQEDAVLSPEDIAAIRKHPGPVLDILARLVARTPDIFPSITDNSEGPSPSQRLGVTAHEAEEDMLTGMGNNVKGVGGEDPLPHVDHTPNEQEATSKMEEPHNAYKELAEIAAEKKTGAFRLLPGLAILVVIGVGALWFTGILPLERHRETTPVGQKKQAPIIHKEKIIQPIKAPQPMPSPENETSLPPDQQTVPGGDKEGDKAPLTEEKPAPSTKEPEPPTKEIERAPVAEKPAALPSIKASASTPDIPPATIENYPYSLHMESVKTLKQAEKSMSAIRKKGLSPYWTRVDLGEKGVWFRVFVGNFKNEADADNFQKSHGITADRILKTAYAIQIGMYSSKKKLDQKVSELRKAGYCPYTILQPHNRYQLLIGAYQTRKAAEDSTARLKALVGQDCEMILR